MPKISNVNLSVPIGDYTGSPIENCCRGEQRLLNLKDVEMLPKFWENKNPKTYNLHIIKGYENDPNAKAAFNYVLKHPNRFTDDTMSTFALMHVLVLYRKKYGLDKEFDPENFKKYMDELLIDYTEMLLQYYKAYGKMAILGPMMRKLWDNYLNGIPKNKLKERINDLKNNPDKIVNKNDEDRKFYCKSWANGAAMHVSPVAFAARCMEELDFMVEQTTKNTHDHPESLKGAKCVGQFIFLGRIKWSKESIKRWIQYKFSTNEYLLNGKVKDIQGNYDMNVSLKDMRQAYNRSLRCKYTVPPALIAVLEANSFKEAVDNARSIGGDCDTICAITAQKATTLWPIDGKYIEIIKKYLLSIKKKEYTECRKGYLPNVTETKTIELEDVNGKKEVIQCCDENDQNILFQNINDEYEKNFGGYYRDSAPIEWQLKNTLSIIKDLHNDIKNIATDQKKQYLIDLINSIKDDLKQFQNVKEMSTKNLLAEIEKEINKLETKVQNLDVKDNYSKEKIKTPEGFYEAPEVVENEAKNENLPTDQKSPKQVINAAKTKTDDNTNSLSEEKIQTVKGTYPKEKIETPEGFCEESEVVNDATKGRNLSTDPKNPEQVISVVKNKTDDDSNGYSEQKIQSEKGIYETPNENNRVNENQDINCFQFIVYERPKLFIFSLISFVLGTPLSIYFAINLMWLYFAIVLVMPLFTGYLLIKTIIDFKQSETQKFYEDSSTNLKTESKENESNKQIYKTYEFENKQQIYYLKEEQPLNKSNIDDNELGKELKVQ